MPLLNYTSTVAVSKTMGEITTILAKHGARQISQSFDSRGRLVGMAFSLEIGGEQLHYRLPVDSAKVLELLRQQDIRRQYQEPAQAERVAWRIMKEWIAAQLAIVETGMVSIDQVMLPYMLVDGDATVFDSFKARRELSSGT